jgi:hypothetical protein
VITFDSIYQKIQIAPIEEDGRIVIFVINGSATDQDLDLDLGNTALEDSATLKTIAKKREGDRDIGVVTSQSLTLGEGKTLHCTLSPETINAIIIKKK